MVLNPFKAIFPKKNVYETNEPPIQESQFSSELSPESVQYSTAISNAASTGMSTAQIATIAGVSTTLAAAVLTTVIVTSVILTATKSPTITILFGYQENCTVSTQCNTILGLSCINGYCLCNSTQYYNGTFCGRKKSK